MAIGVLMAQCRITEQQAFDLMRIASPHRHQKLYDIAEEVVLSGDSPIW
jgi:AmiR/NasT family two-component response regulator